MEKKMNNKGFSLVELIIVVAIMAVLIGVLAPAYLQYVEKSKKTADCTAVGTIMDAIEVVAADPASTWDGTALTVTLGASAGTISGTGATDVQAIADPAGTKITGSWTDLTFTATKDANGKVVFSYSSGGMNTTAIQAVSPALANRFE